MSEREIKLPFDLQLLPARALKAGPLTCLYEQGNLRYLQWKGKEVIRMIYGAIRNKNWETVMPGLSDEKILEDENGFMISYDALYKKEEIHYRAAFSITARKTGSLVFTMEGEALNDFSKNRIGLCVHHPVEPCVGCKVEITNTHSDLVQSTFPELIQPNLVFSNIRAMKFTTNNGVKLKMKFEGDVFETEDHRNWSDNGYKTYGTPIELPFPVTVKKGEKIFQKITLNISGQPAIQKNRPVFREEKIPLPKLGYGSSDALSETSLHLLRQIPFDHYRVELRTTEPGWQQKLIQCTAEAENLEARLELILFLKEDKVDEIVAALLPVQNRIGCILPLQEYKKVTPVTIANRLKQRLPGIKIGYGTDAYFAELNRARPAGLSFDFISFSMNPQVHADDTRSLVENLGRQADLIATAKTFAQAKEIHVSPVTFMKRNNPDATSTSKNAAYIADPRLHTSFAACWTLLCLQNLAFADRITFYEVSDFPSPVYNVLKQIKNMDARYIIVRYKDDNVLMDRFTVENEQGDRLFFSFDLPQIFHGK